MTDASGSLVASFAYDKAYSRKLNQYNSYGIEIPFQFDGRDGTMTATYGDATPQGLVLQVHNSSRISIGNLAPIQASGAMCCTLYGEGEEATCPADGGPDEDCSEGDECPCPHVRGTHYTNNQGEWDEAGYFTEGESGKNNFDCAEALNDYRQAKCFYLIEKRNKGDTDYTVEQWAFMQRFAACIARKAGCKWATHPETTDEGDPVRASDARKLEESPAHGFVNGLTQEEYDECRKYAGS
jgi:hypothetical protein